VWGSLAPQVFGKIRGGFAQAISMSNDGRTFASSHNNGPNVYYLPNSSNSNEEWIPDPTVFLPSTFSWAVLSGDGRTLAVSQAYRIGVFKNTTPFEEWSQIGSFFGTNAKNNMALSNDGNTIAIWTEGDQIRGNVAVYDLHQNDVWVQRGRALTGDAAGDAFGYGLALSRDGTVVALGAPQSALPETPGYVRVFRWSSEDSTWEQVGNDIIGNNPGAQFGNRIVISDNGRQIAITEPYATIPNVKVFSMDSEMWTQVGQTFQVPEPYGLELAVALAGDGTILALGAWFWNGPLATDSGLVQVFTQVLDDVDTAEWSQVGDNFYGAQAADYWGVSVALSRDGRTLAIGGTLVNQQYRGVVATFTLVI